MTENQEWTDTEELILASLAAGMTHAETARVASISSKTVQRRLSDDAFAKEVGRRRGEQVERIAGRLTQLSIRAVETLEASLGDEAASIRLKAADLTLGWLVRVRREADLERRIAEIEQDLATSAGRVP